VASRYGVFNEATGFANRGTFLVDTAGLVRWSIVNGPGQARPLAAYREAVAAL
jgi:alkyl hydroperoxide reductase subunit AhpC